MNRLALAVAAAGACAFGAVLLRRAADRLTDLGLWIEERGGMDTAVRLVADGEDLTPEELAQLVTGSIREMVIQRFIRDQLLTGYPGSIVMYDVD